MAGDREENPSVCAVQGEVAWERHEGEYACIGGLEMDMKQRGRRAAENGGQRR